MQTCFVVPIHMLCIQKEEVPHLHVNSTCSTVSESGEANHLITCASVHAVSWML